MKAFLPAYASLHNPIDVVGDAPAERYRDTLKAVIDDPQVHAILILLTPTASAQIMETADAIIEVAKTTNKPIMVNYMGGIRIMPGLKKLNAAGIPCSIYPDPLINCLETMYDYYLWRQTPAQEYPTIKRNRQKARMVLSEAKAKGAKEVVEFQAQEILRAYNLPTPNTILAKSADEAAAAAEKIGFPVVLKIASPQISHKSDVGGVKVNLADAAAVKAAYEDITTRAQRLRPEANIAGCLVQEMAPKGCKEIIIGFKRDEQFGPLLMFGLGGIYVEILKDIAFRLAPLGRDDAKSIIREIKSYKLLEGARGEAPINFQALEDILLTMSEMALDFPEIQGGGFQPRPGQRRKGRGGRRPHRHRLIPNTTAPRRIGSPIRLEKAPRKARLPAGLAFFVSVTVDRSERPLRLASGVWGTSPANGRPRSRRHRGKTS